MTNNNIVFKDGQLINNNNYYDTLWDGLFSKVKKNGPIIQFIQSCLFENSIFLIPHSDGNITQNRNYNEFNDINWNVEIQPYIDEAKEQNKIFFLGVLSQINKDPNINYIYIPLDDDIFENGIEYFFPQQNLLKWNERSNELCWRGGCSGIGDSNSLRVNFVKKLINIEISTNVRLSNWWSENKNIPNEYFRERIHYTEFLKYKIFFIVDGNVIASNHMWGFATGCIPFIISNANCWFTDLIIPYVHYIPIKYDLSDLFEAIQFVLNNDSKAEQIAQNALLFSKTYFSAEYQHKYLKESILKFNSI